MCGMKLCSVNWKEQPTNAPTYILFLFALAQIVPIIVISFSYANVIYTLKENSQTPANVSNDEATAMVFIMIVAFTVAWTPYSIFALIEQSGTQGTADDAFLIKKKGKYCPYCGKYRL